MNPGTTIVRRHERYWASLPSRELAQEFVTRVNRFSDHAEAYHMIARWRRSMRLTYGYDPDNNGLTWAPVITGSAGQIIRVRINNLLRFKRAHHVLVIGQRPAPQARPTAFDSSATEAVPVANALLDQSTGRGGGERAMHRANWYAQDFGSGWVSARWDEMAGRRMPTGQVGEDGQPVTAPEGDVVIQAHRPDCVVFDVSLDDSAPHQWLALATQRNRYELASEIEQRLAAHGDSQPDRLRGHILGCSSSLRLDKQRVDIFRARFGDDWSQDADMVWIYELFHIATPILPQGRYAMILDGEVLADGANPYSELPLYEHCPLRLQGTRWGYSHFFDLMGPQQVADSHITAATTTAENSGIPGIWVQPGADNGAAVTTVEGLRIIRSMTPPTPVEFSGDAPAKLTASHAYMVEQMTVLSGLNDTALGDTSSASSGKQAAMNHALALQSASDYAASYVSMAEALFNGLIKRYRAFASTERVVQIAGRGRRWQAKRFTAKTLEGIDGIDVQIGAAILRTTAGVVETANTLLQAQQVSRDEYMGMLSSGRLEPAFDGPQRHEALIERENEMLMEGQAPEVAPTDNPVAHIARHRAVLDDPETRTDQAIVSAVSQHLADHDRVWMETTIATPSLLMALEIPPHPMAMQQQAPQGADPGAPEGEPSANAGDVPSSAGMPAPAGAGGGVGPAGEDLPELPEAPDEVMA